MMALCAGWLRVLDFTELSGEILNSSVVVKGLADQAYVKNGETTELWKKYAESSVEADEKRSRAG